MDNLETPYDIEAEFIECSVCEKSIRGETLYKIHLTTPGHIKKEDVLVAAGQAIRKHAVPQFNDVLQYIDYLKLDEPIIGLSYLEEVPSNEPQGGPRYLCRLCHLTANLSETVHHVIGRKHRQKYVELKRPDLVTWDKQSIITQGGKIIRAKAEIIERQDGRGNPLPMTQRPIAGNLNITRIPPRQKQNWDRSIAQNLTPQDVPPLLPELQDYEENNSQGRRHPSVHPFPPSFHSDEPRMNRERQIYQQEDSFRHDHMGEELHSADYRENNMYRREYMNCDNRGECEQEYVEDQKGRAMFKPGGPAMYDPREETQIPYGQAQRGEYYSEETPHRRSYPERDPLKEFYSEEVRRGRVQPPQPMYPEDKQPWSLDRESVRHHTVNRASRPGSSEPEAERSSFPVSMGKDRSGSREKLFNIIKDYQHKMSEPHEEVAVSYPGPSRTGPSSSQTQVEVTRTMSGIPEPFRRFLTGPMSDDGKGRRKRKSRFSDATAEEVEMTKEMFSDEYGPPNPKFSCHPRPVSAPLRTEIHGSQHPDRYPESQSPRDMESYQRGASGSEDVFDLLKSFEIENAEEADFLKNKLCNLLKEFKSKKSEMAAHNNQGRAVLNSTLKLTPQLSPQRQYERNLREDPDLNRPQDPGFRDDHRGQGWKQHEFTPNERLQEYPHPVRGEVRHLNRRQYEEAFGSPRTFHTPHATHPDEPVNYSERFQEPMHPRDYRPASEKYFDSHASSPSLHMDQEPRLHRGAQYSKSLDKITSTLLELVARK